MKAFVHTIAVILLFASCCPSAAKGNNIETFSMVDSVGSDYTANAIVIEQKEQEMLAVADSVGHFWFSDNTEFQSQYPHAYWLMNRMMQMRALYYREFKEWFDINNTVNGIMTFYTEAGSFHSALPMDLNGQFASWSES